MGHERPIQSTRNLRRYWINTHHDLSQNGDHYGWAQSDYLSPGDNAESSILTAPTGHRDCLQKELRQGNVPVQGKAMEPITWWGKEWGELMDIQDQTKVPLDKILTQHHALETVANKTSKVIAVVMTTSITNNVRDIILDVVTPYKILQKKWLRCQFSIDAENCSLISSCMAFWTHTHLNAV